MIAPKLLPGQLVTMRCRDKAPCWDNTHQVIIKADEPDAWIGWPNPNDRRNSEHWKPGFDRPLEYPKFAWEAV